MSQLQYVFSLLVAMYGLSNILIALVGVGVLLIVGVALLPKRTQEIRMSRFHEGYKGPKYVGSQYDNGQDMRSTRTVETERKFSKRK
jgi:hypothetical protein